MIKTKEDLHHTFIDGSCEELKKKLLEKAKEFGLEVNPSAHKNVAIGINLAQVGKPGYFQVDHNLSHVPYYRDLLKYRELTLEDFEEEGKEEVIPTKYKYIPVEVESIFDLKEDLQNNNLVFGDQKKPILGEWALMRLLVGDNHQIYLRKEIKWQNEVIDHIINSRSEYVEGSWQIAGNFLTDDKFLEMCRVALRATGELK